MNSKIIIVSNMVIQTTTVNRKNCMHSSNADSIFNPAFFHFLILRKRASGAKVNASCEEGSGSRSWGTQKREAEG